MGLSEREYGFERKTFDEPLLRYLVLLCYVQNSKGRVKTNDSENDYREREGDTKSASVRRNNQAL